MALFNITRWPVLLVLLLAGLSAAGFAFITVNLFSQAMANLEFIAEFGLLALTEGGLLQFATLLLWGALALLIFLVFRTCEIELLYRYYLWADPSQSRKDARSKMRFKRDGN